MNLSRVFRLISLITLLYGLSMLLAIPWTLPQFGEVDQFDFRSFRAIFLSFLCTIGVSSAFFYASRALFYGKLFCFRPLDGGSFRFELTRDGFLRFLGFGINSVDSATLWEDSNDDFVNNGSEKTSNRPLLKREAIAVVGLTWVLAMLLGALPFWFSRTVRQTIEVPTKTTISETVSDDGSSQHGHVSDAVLVPMDFVNCVFESSSGVTGFGATVINNLEDPRLVPRAILFWRSLLHFLGGLGIMVLFVAILGGKSAGKSLVQTEMPYTRQDSPYTKVRKMANALLILYVGLNVVLTVLLCVEGMSFFDALCHSFGTIATAGFSTYNSSIGHFNSPVIEYTIIAFMFLGGCNFTLLFYVFVLQPGKILQNTEFRTYVSILFIASILVSFYCWRAGNFDSFSESFRYGAFQVVSLITTTGFTSSNFEIWNDVSRGILLLLIFVGGCVGSTSSGLKVMRLVLLWKTLGAEIERIYRPNVVRVLRLEGEPVDNSNELRRSVMAHFCAYILVMVAGFMLLLVLEPDSTWLENGRHTNQKMYDCLTSVATATNCVGPSFGITGGMENFGVFHTPAKVLFIVLMLLGRLEFFVIFAMIRRNFWKG